MKSDFDVIVIGAGAAGCQLSLDLASHGFKIALLEAGGTVSDVRSTVPVYYPKLFRSRFDYAYQTEPEAALRNRRIAWPRGKGIGGSTAINAQIYLQATADDFERWGWDWAGKYIADLCIAPEYPQSIHPWSPIFVEAARNQLGAESPNSLTQAAPNWTGIFQRFNRQGKRHHPGLLVQERPSIQVIDHAQVHEIVFEKGRATGVVYQGATGLHKLHANHAVALCCGTIESPRVLFQSGVGCPSELAACGITCHWELPCVGKNLQDHLVYPIIYEVSSQQGLPQRHSLSSRQDYRRRGQGSLASNIAEAGAIFGYRERDACDLQIHFTPTHYLKYPQTAKTRNHLSLSITDLHPRSRGDISFQKDACGGLQPVIRANYLADANDIERLSYGISIARAIARQPAFEELAPTELIPGHRGRNQSTLEKSIRALAQSIYHPVGTCSAAGPLGGVNGSVLDSNFKVQGIGNLFVADAAALPDLPSANPAACVMLLAKHVASLITVN